MLRLFLSALAVMVLNGLVSAADNNTIFLEPWNRPHVVKSTCGFGTNISDDNENIEIPERVTVQPHWQPSAYGPRFPVIDGTTNLPEGAKVVVEIWRTYLPNAQQRIANGIPPCAGNCNPATTIDGGAFAPRSIVHAGRFTAGPYSLDGAEFMPGTYRLEVYVPAGCIRSVGAISDKEWVDRLAESFRTPVYRGTIVIH